MHFLGGCFQQRLIVLEQKVLLAHMEVLVLPMFLANDLLDDLLRNNRSGHSLGNFLFDDAFRGVNLHRLRVRGVAAAHTEFTTAFSTMWTLVHLAQIRMPI